MKKAFADVNITNENTEKKKFKRIKVVRDITEFSLHVMENLPTKIKNVF